MLDQPLLHVEAGAIEARLRQVLLGASLDPDAGDALQRFLGTSRFIPVSDADKQALARLGAGLTRLRAEVE